MAKSRKINIEDATNKEAAIQWNKVIKVANNEDYRIVICSDGVTRLDLFGIKSHIQEKIKHLPSLEQAAIIIRYDRFSKIKSHMGRLRKRAYGTANEGYINVLEGRKAELLELFAMYYSPEEIHKKLIEESGMVLNIASVHRFHRKYRTEIERLQMEYEKTTSAVGISRKRSRLEVLDMMLRKIKSEFDAASGKQMLPYASQMKNILEQARKEVEGHQINMNVSGSIDITATIESAKTVEQLYADINFMSLLISRVSARMRINPLLLQYQLTNSWYARFTGIKRNDNLMDETPDYPSKIILAWDDLQSKALQKEQEYEDLKEKYTEEIKEIVEPKQVSRADTMRKALMEKFKEKKSYVDDAEARIRGEKVKN